jgi:RND family efflux transporter MFP subunit
MRTAAFALSACLIATQATAQDEKPRPVVSEVVTLISGLTTSWVGTVAAPNEVDLGFPRIGTVADRDVDVGDVVEKGQLLARQDPEELDAAVRSASAGVAVAEAQLRTASDADRRAGELVSRGFASPATVDTARSALVAAKSALAQAEATLAQAKDALSDADLRAPQDGVITQVFAEPGANLSVGEPIVRLASTSGREIVIDLSEKDAAAMEIGAAFKVQLQSNPDIISTAMVERIDAVADRATRTRRGHLNLDREASEAFRLGALVLVKRVSEDRSFITLPVTALIDEASPPRVWVVSQNDRRVHRTEVDTGPSAGGRVVILSGLSIGEEVVTKGVNSIEDGQIVGPGASE